MLRVFHKVFKTVEGSAENGVYQLRLGLSATNVRPFSRIGIAHVRKSNKGKLFKNYVELELSDSVQMA